MEGSFGGSLQLAEKNEEEKEEKKIQGCVEE
jgi:hypothetical protein